jgi:hypothetical protein
MSPQFTMEPQIHPPQPYNQTSYMDQFIGQSRVSQNDSYNDEMNQASYNNSNGYLNQDIASQFGKSTRDFHNMQMLQQHHQQLEL